MSWVQKKVINRLREPSSYAGLGLVALGIGQMFQISEAQPVAEAITQAAQNPNPTGIATAVLGLLAFFVKEKGAK